VNFTAGLVRSSDLSRRVQRRLRALQLRTRHRLGFRPADPGHVGLASAFQHPIDVNRKAVLIARYRELFPESVDAELAEAARLATHRFSFLGHTVQHGDRIAWSRDPISGRDWPRAYSSGIAYRGPERLGDIKLPWELNKHQYFFTLGKVSWLNDDASLAAEIVRQIDQWIDDNPYYTGIHWISALEAGSRVISWILAYPFFADCLDIRVRDRMLTSLAEHLKFVEEHLSTGPFANTHLVGEAAALIIGGLFLECRHSTRWLQKGLDVLQQEVDCQVTPDGMHAERSVQYHRFFLDQYYLVAALLAANGKSLSSSTLHRMEEMTSFLMYMLFPDGTAPAFGDGDDARGLWLRGQASPADFSGLLALGAVLFKRGDFKAVAGGGSEEVLWLFGPEGIAAFNELAGRTPEHASVSFADAGYYVMRGGWGRSDPVLVFDCGPVGFGPAGHGHADALSFQLHTAGYAFYVDSGTFSYNVDYEWRDVFRGTRAHNTVVVDGENQSVPGDRMSWKSTATCHGRRWVTTQWFDAAEGEHDGYRRLPDPVTHRRVLVFLKPDVWVIWDDLRGAGRHDLDLLLHVRPDCRVDDDGEGGKLLASPEGHRIWTGMSGSGLRGSQIEVITGGERERGAWFSPSYGMRAPSRALSRRGEIAGQSSLATWVSSSPRIRPVVVAARGALDVCLRRDDASEDRLWYRTDGEPVEDADGVSFDGAVLFLRRNAGRPSTACASGVRRLRLEGLLEVTASAEIERLALHDDRCELTIAEESVSGLVVTARQGIELLVNGWPRAPEAFRVR
jgi:hypothetical protein